MALVLVSACKDERRDPPPQPQAEPAEPAPKIEAPPEPARDPKQTCVDELLARTRPQLHALVRPLCAEWSDQQIPGVAVAMAEPGRPPIHLELGVRCRGRPEPVEVETAFRIGSVSKLMTAALALELVEGGQLSMTSEAGELVAGLEPPTGLDALRLGPLLRHRSGLGEIEPAVLVARGGDWLAALREGARAGERGEFRYSNTGYSVVGAMIEAATGERYAPLIDERIAARLELPTITAIPANARGPACGHLGPKGGVRVIEVDEDLDFMPGDASWMSPAGGVLASARDLARFALAIGGPELPGSAAMLEPGEPIPAELDHREDARYGHGLRSWSVGEGARIYAHSGDNGAFHAELMFVPGGRAIAILANRGRHHGEGPRLRATLSAAETLLASEAELENGPADPRSVDTEAAPRSK